MDPYSRHAATFKAHQKWLEQGQDTIMVAGQPYPAATTIVWNNQPFAIVPGSAKFRKNLEPGGFKMQSDFSFNISVDQFPGNGTPTLKQLITYLNQAYRIDAITTLAGGQLQRFDCNDPNQPASTYA